MSDFDECALSAYFYRCRLLRLKPETIVGYAERLEYLRRWAAKRGKGLTTLTTTDLEVYFIEMMDADLSGVTINGRLRMFRQFYTFLIEHRLADADPTRTLSYVRPEKRRKVLLHPDDFWRVILAVRHRRSFFSVRNECILLLTYDSLVRLRELTSMRVSDLRIHPDRMVHVMGKGRKERIVSFGEETAQRLLIYLSRRSREQVPGELLFSTADGRALSKRNVEHIFDRAGRRVDPPVKLTPHLVRHSVATIMREATGDMQLIRDILGHESVSTTELYTHSSQFAIVEAYRRYSPVTAAARQANR